MLVMPGHKDDIGNDQELVFEEEPGSNRKSLIGSFSKQEAQSYRKVIGKSKSQSLFEEIPQLAQFKEHKHLSYVQQLLRMIHMRFEQKFKDYRMAFRHFDVNFDGTVEFHEFIGGLESCGINMPYSDYRLVWDLIDYDNAKEITFSKFCLINMDKSNNVLDLIKNTIKNNEQLQQYLHEVEERKYF